MKSSTRGVFLKTNFTFDHFFYYFLFEKMVGSYTRMCFIVCLVGFVLNEPSDDATLCKAKNSTVTIQVTQVVA